MLNRAGVQKNAGHCIVNIGLATVDAFSIGTSSLRLPYAIGNIVGAFTAGHGACWVEGYLSYCNGAGYRSSLEDSDKIVLFPALSHGLRRLLRGKRSLHNLAKRIPVKTLTSC